MPILTLDDHNRLHLPEELLKRLELRPGDRLEAELDNGTLLLRRVAPPSPSASPVQRAISRKNLQTGIQFIRGVGPKLAELLAKKEITTVEDALFCLPHRYEDRRQLTPIRLLKPGGVQVFQGTVQSAGATTTKGGRRFFEAVVADDSGSISLKWFNTNPVWMQRTWKTGRRGIFSGEVSLFGHQRELHHPDVEWLEEGQDAALLMAADQLNYGRLVPVYPLTEGLHQKGMRRVMAQVTEQFLPNVENVIPPRLLPAGHLPLREALEQVHCPPVDAPLAALNEGRTPAHRSLAFDEFFFWELGMALKKRGITLEEGISFQVTHRYTKELAKLLPFQLTAAQRRVLSEIKEDMMAPHPMHRLVQGDVGSGKTVVALMAALVAVENGYQVAIMAPTEILAEQHWHNIHHWCEQLGVTVVLMTAAMKGKARTEALAQIADGRAAIVIGTHAVIQEKVAFHRLGLGIVDEQHRFGVLQRSVLKKKGQNPDILVMTATPIPRTLAMTLFGDLSLSVIDELPPGRTPIETRVFFESRRSQVYAMVREEVAQGRQAYLIYPLVEESEKSDLKAASQMAEHLQQEVFPELRVGLIHGRMKPEEKERAMLSFKARELDILVATTVIEVGIDVPNATLMVIEHAERFGLSQLHQLRGRVGRGSHRSRCILLTPGNLSEDGRKRLQVMEATTDGFRIAEADLEIRGPGDFLGTRQSGMPDFRVASILRDGSILEQARDAAVRLLAEDDGLGSAEGQRLREELVRRWGTRLELAGIA
ncbi:ATP-dependent DNA helicase RecG [Trichlorobacter ammonificans]|uniref:ATP-dependent DNA helicase RecG n=1 Tax=Trichlorobacter ammonificans TaxID=2916410 RepID=A0ABM9D964_9BACT|nr:ATP-dependent DNA helicase RecG [Trichlorobacter ammonificans]CAH2031676.1 ATP-dependent DNA helicase RecG [Trichlorobacter ammonificans]